MRPLPFIVTSILVFPLLAVLYTAVVDGYIIQKCELPFSFNEFILQASGSIEGKVVIESGSNSLHGLDAFALSEYFQAPVLIAADGTDKLNRQN